MSTTATRKAYRCQDCGKVLRSVKEMEQHCPKAKDPTARHTVRFEALFNPAFK